MKEINQIVHDDRTYIESVGRQDRETVREALADNGANTVLRVCIGVMDQEAPLRTLGYFASGLAVQEHYFPEAELQFVFPIKTFEAVNGRDLDETDIEMATDIYPSSLYYEARSVFPRLLRADSPSQADVKPLNETELPDEALQAAVAEVLETEPELKAKFKASARLRKADHILYVAAHVLLHDTNPALEPFNVGCADGPLTDYPCSDVARVISIGAQSERPFYLARMACQQAKILQGSEQMATGQLFTKHVLPPYFYCREGEPGIFALKSLSASAETHRVPSVRRDLNYLRIRANDERAALETMTRVVEREEYCYGKVLVREFI